MLKDEVAEAIERGEFHVWAADRVDEGIEFLTGVPAGGSDDGPWPEDSVYGRVHARLREMARLQRLYARGVEDKNDAEDKGDEQGEAPPKDEAEDVSEDISDPDPAPEVPQDPAPRNGASRCIDTAPEAGGPWAPGRRCTAGC